MAKAGSTLTRLRDYALILLPAAYAVGFLSWSIHQTGTGMGFRSLSVPHYLVASFPVIAITGLGALLRAWLEHVFSNRHFWPWLHDSAAFLFSAWVVLGMMGVMGALHWSLGEFVPIILVIGLMPAATRSGVALVNLIMPSTETPTRLIGTRTRETRTPHKRFAGDWLNVFSPAFTVFVLLLMLNGGSLLGDIQQSFGGAAPRAAYLDLDPSKVEPSWQQVLFPVGADLNASVARTVAVEVHHRNSDFILFRTAAEPDRGDRLYDLSTDAVRAIVWCGNSCDTWLPAPNP